MLFCSLGCITAVNYVLQMNAHPVHKCTAKPHLSQIVIFFSDESPPQIRCRSSFEEQLFADSQRAVYDPLNFVLSQADNSGIVALTFSVNPLIIDRYSIGETYTVKIDAKDPSSNSDTCLVQVKVTGGLTEGREGRREKERERERERERESVCVCVCVFVCDRERERERERVCVCLCVCV